MVAGSTRAKQVLGGLSDLPVAVLEGAFQGRLDVVTLERREGQYGPASDRRSVLQATQYRCPAPLVAERPEGGHGGLPAEGVLVASGFRSGHGREGVDGRLGDFWEFAGRPAGHLHHGVVGIAQTGRKEHYQGRGESAGLVPISGVRTCGLVVGLVGAGLVRAGQGLQGPPADSGFRVAKACCQLAGREPVDST